ncbi:MAG: hypothetical protein PHX74_00505 [Candidatus Sumerlaeales bacterium]|nr:hypothetical protein [Candidatus Sumerlaeales bacterium]
MPDVTTTSTATEERLTGKRRHGYRWYPMWCVLLIVALVAGWHMSGFGAPHPCIYSSDEYDVISRSVKLAQGDLLPIHASKPTAYNVAVAVSYGVDFVVRHVVSGLSVAQYERLFFVDPFHFTRLARFISICFSFGTVLLLLWGLRRCHALAWVTGVLLLGLLCNQTVSYRVWAKEDAFAAFWVMLSFVAANECWHGLASGATARRLYVWLGVCAGAAGLALSTKYNCLPVVLFPCIVGHRLARVAPRSRRGFVMAALLTGLPLVGGFFVGTPYALLHPFSFVERTLSSPVAHQTGGGFLYVHNLGKTDLAFLWQMFVSEYWVIPALFIAGAVGLFAARKSRPAAPLILWGSYVAVYVLMLCFSSQLDYQYMLILSPIVVFVVASAYSLRLSRGVLLVVTGVLSVVAVAVYFDGWRAREARYYPNEGALFAENYDVMVGAENRAKPVLVFSPFFFRYWPWIALDRGSYERLYAEAKAAGREGGWFERAAHWAPTNPARQFSADFLEIKTGFTVDKNGTRHFESQPFSLNLADYRGKYSLFVIPARTLDIVERNLPELADFNAFVREALKQPKATETDGFSCAIRLAN